MNSVGIDEFSLLSREMGNEGPSRFESPALRRSVVAKPERLRPITVGSQGQHMGHGRDESRRGPTAPANIRHMVSFQPDMRFHVHMRSMPNISEFDKDLALRLRRNMRNFPRDALKSDLQLSWLADGPQDPFPWEDFNTFRARARTPGRSLRPPRDAAAARKAQRAELGLGDISKSLRPTTSEPTLPQRLDGEISRHLASAPTRELMQPRRPSILGAVKDSAGGL